MQNEDKDQPFVRSRKLIDAETVWDHNSWQCIYLLYLLKCCVRDDVEWDDTKAAEAEAVLAAQLSAAPGVKSADEDIITESAAERWNDFYNNHERSFFKDRMWLNSEFPELFKPDSSVLELGCGAGNTILPLAKARQEIDSSDIPRTGPLLHACDFAPKAVDLVKEQADPRRLHVFLHDLAQDACFNEIHDGSIDTVVAIFVLSAIDPSKLPFCFEKIFKVLRPGGLLLFRDYGRYDMTQLRFKASRVIRPDLYFRGDGTAVHYFTESELTLLAQRTGLSIDKLYTDRRLLVNRQRKLTMYRIWIQASFKKI